MNIFPPSLEMQIEDGKTVQAAKALLATFQSVNLQLVNKVSELNSHKMDSDEELELTDNVKNKDPAIIAVDVAAQMVRDRFSYPDKIISFWLTLCFPFPGISQETKIPIP